MTHLRPSRFAWLLVLTLGLWAVAAQAKEFRYHFVSLEVELPEGVLFFDPKAINNRGRIYGDAYECTTTCDVIRPHIAVSNADGAVTVLQPGQPGSVHAPNERGTIGGGVVSEIR